MKRQRVQRNKKGRDNEGKVGKDIRSREKERNENEKERMKEATK